jgi:hypothetical protein
LRFSGCARPELTIDDGRLPIFPIAIRHSIVQKEVGRSMLNNCGFLVFAIGNRPSAIENSR